nr:hypothetical protein [Mycoplasmopsis bovis]
MPIDELKSVNLEIFLEKSNYWTKNGTKVKFILLMYALVVLSNHSFS